jgi:hypothetical protein
MLVYWLNMFRALYAHHQEYNSEFHFLVSKPGKPSGLCSAGLLDVCTVQSHATSSEQYTAVHSSTRQCTAVHCSIRQYTTVHNSTRQYTTVHGSTQQCTAVHSSTRQCTAVHSSTQQYTTAHTSNSPALHNPDGFPGLDTKKRNSLLFSWRWTY